MINVRGKAARRREWALQTRMSLAFERGLTGKLRREFRTVAAQAKAQFDQTNNVELHNLETRHAHRLTNIIKPYAKAAIKTFAIRLLHLLSGKSGMAGVNHRKMMTEDELNEYSDEYVDKWVRARVTDISKTTAKRIADAIKEGREEEMTHDEISDLIQERTAGSIGEVRARTIARTEIHSASQSGSMASAETSGIPGLMKEWLTVGDDRVRDDHMMVDGDRAQMDEPFDVGDSKLMYPGDPDGSPEETINCRCVLTYSTEPE